MVEPVRINERAALSYGKAGDDNAERTSDRCNYRRIGQITRTQWFAPVADMDGSVQSPEDADKSFLMYPEGSNLSVARILFYDWTRRHLNLVSKGSVERR